VGDDEALARLAASGHTAAFERLVRRHEGGVRNFLRRVARDDADDLAQETFIRAWRLAHSFRGSGSYRAWLYRIAWRVFLSSRKPQAESGDFEPAAEPDKSDSATRIDIERAIGALSERERAAAILCFAEGCSHSEAATVLGLPLGTVKSLAARARAKLISILESNDD
jgi:RNA polymerase sigma-70 factor (ECF subfamily)